MKTKELFIIQELELVIKVLHDLFILRINEQGARNCRVGESSLALDVCFVKGLTGESVIPDKVMNYRAGRSFESHSSEIMAGHHRVPPR
jgi:hypothetical protein